MTVLAPVTELALLSIRSGDEDAFESAFARVAGLVAAADGHLRHRLVRSVDQAGVYLLEVEWRDLTAHVDVFEPSDAHTRFMAALAPFFAAEPSVIHFPGRRNDDR
jgi:heme-degrading monooxygenase HmoA